MLQEKHMWHMDLLATVWQCHICLDLVSKPQQTNSRS